jgi:hypothetical protein
LPDRAEDLLIKVAASHVGESPVGIASPVGVPDIGVRRVVYE